MSPSESRGAPAGTAARTTRMFGEWPLSVRGGRGIVSGRLVYQRMQHGDKGAVPVNLFHLRSSFFIAVKRPSSVGMFPAQNNR